MWLGHERDEAELPGDQLHSISISSLSDLVADQHLAVCLLRAEALLGALLQLRHGSEVEVGSEVPELLSVHHEYVAHEGRGDTDPWPIGVGCLAALESLHDQQYEMEDSRQE